MSEPKAYLFHADTKSFDGRVEIRRVTFRREFLPEGVALDVTHYPLLKGNEPDVRLFCAAMGYVSRDRLVEEMSRLMVDEDPTLASMILEFVKNFEALRDA